MEWDGPGRGHFSFFDILYAGFSLLVLAAVIALIVLLVRFLIVGTRAAQIYVRAHEPSRSERHQHTPPAPGPAASAPASAPPAPPAAPAPAAAAPPAEPEFVAPEAAAGEPTTAPTRPMTQPTPPKTPRRAPRKRPEES